ncbi:hypothetical protein POX_g08925 [Penicillium oxalicum]|uniref:hypothetical protein n=1 Tax=Penicillium oxalicum TaxID=69781 RepID=UPI0020B671DB|nr:hypothetical protein POX_g08925 [Penicillium oxalicum]KAI2786539.1 hypothetical protein POX_g08925 [Penicillium oxalicum]
MPEPQSNTSGPVHSIRRAVTLPTKLNPHAQRSKGNLSENVIFYHPFAKIVHFAPRALVPIPSSSTPSDFDYPVDTIETLPWRSATERTVATAPLRLERGLTVFLKCGNVVRAILRNSQCWCVDGVSKFVLRIRPLTYYRIELPYETAEDKALVEDLKAALPNILRYEVTPCPFKRAFSVELPEEAIAPRRKKAWKPKEIKDGLSVAAPVSQRPSIDAKVDWPDSVSTGDDTDGATTDDSGLTSERTNSTTSETILDNEAIPTDNTSTATPSLPMGRSSLPETKQTFTNLREKFDATPVSQVSHDQEENEQMPATMALDDVSLPGQTSTIPVADPLISDKQNMSVSTAVQGSQTSGMKNFTHDENSQTPYGQVLEPTSVSEMLKGLESPSNTSVGLKTHPALGAVADDRYIERYDHLSATPELDRVPTTSENRLESPAQKTSLSVLPTHECAVPDHEDGLPTPKSVNHDADQLLLHHSSSSMRDSTSSNGDSSPNSDVASNIEATSQERTAAVSSGTHLASQDQAANTSAQALSSEESSPPLKMPHYVVREEPPKQPASRSSSSVSLHDTSASFLSPDMDHMSSEFRRRAQATRQRDVSPMPPQSALYQPPPNEQASSLLSKALSLVLVPPIHLFIILLHVAARIVISPAIGSAQEGFTSGSKALPYNSSTEDDFSFPLERESSSEYEDARITRKLDPWDLD